MKEHPILFSAPMIRAILAGQKTMTRRIVKPQPNGFHHSTGKPMGDYSKGIGPAVMKEIKCRYGEVGDRLWVREHVWLPPKSITAKMLREGADTWPKAFYVASDPNEGDWCREHGWRSTPSIHMPRWASRITLEITGVRMERLQAISEMDAMAEGVEAYVKQPVGYRHAFIDLWRKINGLRSWEDNPFVWAISKRRLP